MARELRGKIKEPLWNRSVCSDSSESLRLRRMARKDFKRLCRQERIAVDVASIDAIDECQELGDQFDWEA
jgi:hypothetical protein